MADAVAVVAAAESIVSLDRLIEICAAMVDQASPTGGEGPLARRVGDVLDDAGLDAGVQELSVGPDALGGDMANAHGRLAGHGGGPSLLMYAPLDTVTVGDAEHDLPWAGPDLRPDMQARADVRDGLVIGLGAQNPKGHGACVIAAAEALIASGAPLRGDLIVGFGAGGMPSSRRAPDLSDGHGVGCDRLVDLLAPDEAVIAKTGWAISWEEVGLTWFTVDVAGTHTYVGSRHLLPYRNAIADASHLIAGLERWFPVWAEQHTDELIAPQGIVAAVEGGWPYMAAFTTALCRFHVDLRLHPDTSPDEAAAAFGAEVQRLAAEIDADVTWTQSVAIPGTMTDPSSDIIRSSIACWESLTGIEHRPIPHLSGATDANILRARGVPTARVGLPKVSSDKLDIDFQLGMNAVDVDDMMQLTRLLIRIAVARCGVTP